MAVRERVAVLPDVGHAIAQVREYMPGNYDAVDLDGNVVVFGHDSCGWTLDDYVIPRLASGLWFAQEVEGERAAKLYSRAVLRAAGEADPGDGYQGSWEHVTGHGAHYR
jgi:hypothetical protein